MRIESPQNRSKRFFIALLLSIIICIARIASGILWGHLHVVGVMPWICLVVGVFAFGHALFSVGELLPAKNDVGTSMLTSRRIQRWVIQAIWLGVTYAAIMTWPRATLPPYSLSSLFVVIVVFGLPIAVAESPLGSKSLLRIADKYRLLLSVVSIGAMLVATLTFLVTVRPSIGGFDFFFYLCQSREMIEEPENVPDACYTYFPGMFAFWRTSIRLTGGSIDGLQWSYLSVLLGNAALLAAIVARTCRSMAASIYAGIWYFVLCSRMQGFLGTTEPLATLFFLFGMFVWAGAPMRGRRGLVCGVAMGIGLGLALFCKQPGGLLSLGALSLLINYLVVRGQRRHSFRLLLLIPLVAIIVVAVAFACEGKGIRPLQVGLRYVGDFQAYGSWLSNLHVLMRRDETIHWTGGLVATAWIAILLRNSRWQRIGEPWCELVGFCTIAGLATLIQFQRRPHAHYALLTAPVLIIAGVLLWMQVVPWLVSRAVHRRTAWFFLSLLALFPMIDLDGNYETLRVWRLTRPEWQTIWHNKPKVAADLRRLKESVPPRAKMFIVPPGCLAPRYLLNTRSIVDLSGELQLRGQHLPDVGHYYAHEPNPDVYKIPWSQFDYVLMVDGDTVGPVERAPWPDSKCQEAEQLLKASGYEKELELETMSLFRRQLSHH